MNTPLNGRIAIIDDQLDQALPLMNALSMKRCPYLYYSGDPKFLPQEGDQPNDIRILFLDINLLDNKKRPDKEVRAILVPVLLRIISRDNYPYLLVYWSRHEAEHDALVKDIFDKDLSDRKPIAFLSQNKPAYFDLEGNKTAQYEAELKQLFNNIEAKMKDHQAYRHLVDWENFVHVSADKTLQEVFSSYHTYNNWDDNAGYLINKLGESYSGKSTFEAFPNEEKIRSSFQAFNNVFIDTLETIVANAKLENSPEIKYNEQNAKIENIFSVNKKLLVSSGSDQWEYSGTIVSDSNPKSEDLFSVILNMVLSRKRFEEEVLTTEKGKSEAEIKKLADKLASAKRKEIRKSWKRIYLVVTPLCDFVQKKCFNNRIVKGFLIKDEFLRYIDDRSEAIFVSPRFRLDGDVYVIVLHFRYFFTSALSMKYKHLQPILRVRQQLLAEIQSKLARHVSRQGVLFIDQQ